MSVSPLLYIWGNDELLATRAVDRLAAALAAEGGVPLDRWDVRGQRNGAETLLANLQERIATPFMFGGGTMAVVTNVGALMVSTDGRDSVLTSVRLLAPGNALVFLEAARSGAKGPTRKVLTDAITAAGGQILERSAPKKGGDLAGWITAEARDRGISLEKGAAIELAGRVGGFVDQGDAERRYQTLTASTELDKLALYRGTALITVDDVRSLVAEAMPGTIWGFVDAVGERKPEAALASLERLLEATAEPVLLVVLHRRIRELIELGDRLAGGASLPMAAKAIAITSEYRARKLAEQTRLWTTDELTDALHGLLELDAQVKGAPGTSADGAQRRLAFTLWVLDHVGRRQRQIA
jgi:DNA polymerase III subunit delta